MDEPGAGWQRAPADWSGAGPVMLLQRLVRAGRIALDAVDPAEAPHGLAELLADWRRLGVPVVRDGEALVWRPDPGAGLDPDRIASALAGAGQGCPFAIELVTDSTNARLLARGAAGEPAPQLLLAEVQSAGRGRRQRSWLGRYGESILFSVLLRPRRPPAQWPGLALAAGVALADTLDRAGVAGIGVKWPNDLVLGPGKLAGILVEAAAGAAGGGAVVIGLGLNWALGAETRAGLTQAGADLRDHLEQLPGDRSTLAGVLAASVLAMAARFEADGLAPFRAAFPRFDVLRDRPVLVHADAGTPRAGIARGLAQDGGLRVEHEGGVCTWHSADVTIRPA
jgi:BirA family biotin operon repressor/biotin-[acetyl-CoA-carboxylase] ligase